MRAVIDAGLGNLGVEEGWNKAGRMGIDLVISDEVF